MNLDLPVKMSVGYMLKVFKAQLEINEYKKEFNAIRHGDYKDFMNLIKTPIPFMVVYNHGKLSAEENNRNYDFDFEGLLKSGVMDKINAHNLEKPYWHYL